ARRVGGPQPPLDSDAGPEGDQPGGVIAHLGAPEQPAQLQFVEGPPGDGPDGADGDALATRPRRGPVPDFAEFVITVDGVQPAGAEQLAAGGVADREGRAGAEFPVAGPVRDEALRVFVPVRARYGGPTLDVRILAGAVHDVGVGRSPRPQQQTVL